MQLTLFLPIFVYLYIKREWAGHLFAFIIIMIDQGMTAHTCLKYGLRAGPFAEENWYLFAYVFQKPWFKFTSFAMGIMAARIYMRVLSFRHQPEEEERKKRHPCLNKLHKSAILHSVMFLIGFGLVLFNLLIGHSAIASPYSWNMTENAVYFSLTRSTYVLGVWLILFTFFTGGFTLGKAFMGRTIFRVLGKLTIESALITPMMVQLIYSQLPNGLFVQFNKVLELGLGNVVCVMVASFGLYLLFEYPFRRLIEFSL